MSEPTRPQSNEHVQPKWQTEVEQILEQSDRAPTPVERARSAALTTRHRAPHQTRAMISQMRHRFGDGFWLALAVFSAILAWLVSQRWPLPGRILVIVSVILIIMIIARSVLRTRSDSGPSRTWRGRDIDSDFPGWNSWRSRDRSRGPKDDGDPPKVGSR